MPPNTELPGTSRGRIAAGVRCKYVICASGYGLASAACTSQASQPSTSSAPRVVFRHLFGRSHSLVAGHSTAQVNLVLGFLLISEEHLPRPRLVEVVRVSRDPKQQAVKAACPCARVVLGPVVHRCLPMTRFQQPSLAGPAIRGCLSSGVRTALTRLIHRGGR